MKVGFIGLGSVGAELAGSLLRNGFDLTVRDLDQGAAQPLLAAGAHWARSPAEMMLAVDAVITCLPTPAASAAVLEAEEGLLSTIHEGQIWMEMSTTDDGEVRRLGEQVRALGGEPADCPVSGGCHRAETANISIFAGCERATFERVLPLLTAMGRRILHTGALGSASILKVVTNYLATANLVSCCEALVTAKAAGLDLNTTWEAMRISSGNSFVNETESQVIFERLARHLVHDGACAQGHWALPECRRSLRCAGRTQPGSGRHLQRRRSAVRFSRVVAQHRPPS